ncbi:replication protein [Clostridium beijerinckii]|uniref:Replication protein n=1 Tax=Clostridium beijerinckii TaxID=1520 RepID=A0AAW3WEN4_CLOBE|nr:replication protein [Clostridium beijerinckii]MBC2459391.1 replication protein [Clostridium beijerinckii]MBC2476913.1 replication protein [Clostridium beijerinckii]NOV62725.1 hypothetical protein [Clostridium beijerinckii]NOV70313.1 hypothetical protein [Clostridium beijerinckii]NOW30779.1 hypothetical protein [Clostridium beijerinckii]
MAQRRMVSLKIIDSARFLKMPMSTRLLYYDLCIRADDDGIVEGFNILRVTGATEDDLKVLISKNFIKVLNEDLVSYVIDWTEHNKIRADRKTDSIYKELLLKTLPDIQLLEPKERADLKKKKEWTSTCQPKDGIGKDRLGKDRLGKVNNIYSSETNEYRLSLLLKDLIINRDSKSRAKDCDLQKWCIHIDRLVRLDGRTPGEVEKVIMWCQNDSFWCSNILSTEKLRKQFDTLYQQMKIGMSKSKGEVIGNEEPTRKSHRKSL